MVSAIIVAAGKGTRMQMDEKKQFILVNDKSLVAWSIEAFQKCNDIDEIILVTNKEDIEFCKSEIVEKYDYGKVRGIVAGGSSRGESVYNGLREAKCDYVLIHDGARPLISPTDISRCVEEVKVKKAVCMAVPVKDTIKVVDECGVIDKTPKRDTLWSAQTPQVFEYELIFMAYSKAIQDGYESTDDCSVVERLGIDVHVVMGSYENIKITTKEDVNYLKLIMQKD